MMLNSCEIDLVCLEKRNIKEIEDTKRVHPSQCHPRAIILGVTLGR
jgi:hypothetical protein